MYVTNTGKGRLTVPLPPSGAYIAKYIVGICLHLDRSFVMFIIIIIY